MAVSEISLGLVVASVVKDSDEEVVDVVVVVGLGDDVVVLGSDVVVVIFSDVDLIVMDGINSLVENLIGLLMTSFPRS